MDSPRKKLVATANTVRAALDRSEAVAASPPSGSNVGPLQSAAMLGLLGRVRKSIEDAQAEVGENVLSAPHSTDPRAREAAILLSLLAEGEGGSVTAERSLPAGQEAKFEAANWMEWVVVAWEKMKHWRPHPILRPPARIDAFPRQGRIAIVGDWGTNLYGAPECARSIAGDARGFAMLLHLGDVYYSGTHGEMKERFLDVWPKRSDPGLVRRALNGNHEMYSGGDAYFEDVLPAFGQAGSYFASANEDWLLVGLDTAYQDHDLDEGQLAWLDEILGSSEAAGRKVVLFSHHQLFSRLDGQGPGLETKLGKLLREGRVKAWYWGHEHRCAIYEPHPGWGGLQARCIGHGGMPETRTQLAGWPSVRNVTTRNEEVMIWRRFDALPGNGGGMQTPGGLMLDGRNHYIPGEEEKFLPHGFATLEFNGPDLVERMLTPAGIVIHEQKVG